MKQFKTIFFVACFLMAAITLNAQENTVKNAPQKKVTFGLKAGLNFADITSEKGDFNNTKTKAGFHAGITLDFAITPNWYVLTGLEYASKGVKIELSPSDQDITAAYVQLPISAGYKFYVSEDLNILVNAGPYFAYGVHGKFKQGSYEQDTFSDEVMKNFDAGIQLGATLEWKKLCFSLGGEVGVVNVMQRNSNEAQTQTTTLSIGYKF